VNERAQFVIEERQWISTGLLHHRSDSGTSDCAAPDDTLSGHCVHGPSEIDKQSVNIFCASVSFPSLPPPSLQFHESRNHPTGPLAWQTDSRMMPVKVMRASVELIIIIQICFQFVQRWHWMEWKPFNVWNLKTPWIAVGENRVACAKCCRRGAVLTYVILCIPNMYCSTN
jgi:hypothetical protein